MMADNLIIEQLHDDHRQLVRILYHLEREIKAYSGLIKADAGLEKILEILDYVQVYPEMWHHPVEDIIYQELLTKDKAAAVAVADIMAEHETLELLTENLQEYINQLAGGQCQAPEKIKARLLKATADYIGRQLRHMEREQSALFPLIEKHIQPQDWGRIKLCLKSRLSLQQQPALQEYRQRFQSIANSAAVTACQGR